MCQTQNGEPLYVVQDPTQFEMQQEQIALLYLLSFTEKDIKSGRVVSSNTLRNNLRNLANNDWQTGQQFLLTLFVSVKEDLKVNWEKNYVKDLTHYLNSDLMALTLLSFKRGVINSLDMTASQFRELAKTMPYISALKK